MTLAEFLLARIAEDERVARAADVKQGDASWKRHGPIALSDPRAFKVRSERDSRPIARVEDVAGDIDDPDCATAILDGSAVSEHIAHWDPARVLAECEAKRRIVEDYAKCVRLRDIEHHVTDYSGGELAAYETAVRFLALPHADHPDYRQEWKP